MSNGQSGTFTTRRQSPQKQHGDAPAALSPAQQEWEDAKRDADDWQRVQDAHNTPATSVPSLSETFDASRLTSSDRAAIESACSGARLVHGAAAYHRCMSNQLRELAEVPYTPDLSRLDASARASIESSCAGARLVQGAAAYHRCLGNQLRELEEVPSAPDLSRLNASDRASIESACSGARLVQGAAAYHRCLTQQLHAHSKRSQIDQI